MERVSPCKKQDETLIEFNKVQMVDYFSLKKRKKVKKTGER